MPELTLEIVALFTRDSEDLFDKTDVDSLNVCVHVAAKFRDYLQGEEGNCYPSSDEENTSYIVGTIASGIDDFLRMFHLNRILKNSIESRLDLDSLRNFAAFKVKYKEAFADLQKPGTSLQARLRGLIDLGKMQLVFLGAVLT